MSSIPHNARFRYLFNRRSLRSFVVPMDHGISMGPIPGLYDMADTVGQMAGTGVNCVIVHKGLVRSIAPVLARAPDVGLMVHLCASTSSAPDPNEKQLVCNVEEALSLGADGVSVHVNIGADTEGQMLRDFAETAEQCRRLNVPLLAMMYARGPRLRVQFSEAFSSHCARVAYEIGADMVKVQYTGDPQSFSRVVQSVPIPVLIAGGPKMSNDREVLEMIQGSLDAGAAGISIGRNVFGAERIGPLCKAIGGMLHEGVRAEKAMQRLSA
jgi:class I fructose-bisphosphate aldolase